MTQQTGLIVVDRPKAQLLMVLDPLPLRASLPEKPQWMMTSDWVQLHVWLTLMTNPREPLHREWYHLIDAAYRALLESLRAQRIVNVDAVKEAQDALPNVASVYMWLCPILYPVLRTILPQIREGYRIRCDDFTKEGCYLMLTLP